MPFLPALGAGFVNWDDESFLVAEPGYRSPGALRWALAATALGHWSPLVWLSFAMDHWLGGLDPRVFHATSLVLHGLNAALFYLLARRLLAAAWPDGAARLLTGGAALAALGFAVHPLRVEPVAWISDRRDLLCATFLLLALMAHVRGARKGGPLERGWFLASLAAFAAALGRSMRMPRWTTCGSEKTASSGLIGPAGTCTDSSLASRSACDQRLVNTDRRAINSSRCFSRSEFAR